MTPLRGSLTAAATYVLWGLLTIYWKQLHGLAAMDLIGVRITLSAALLALVLTALRQWGSLVTSLRDRVIRRRLALAALLLSTNWTTYVWAVGHDHVVETALGYFVSPLLTTVLGIVIFGERSTRAQRIAIALGGVAMVVLVGAYGRVPVVAVLLASSWSFYSVLKRQVPLSPVQSLAGETFLVAGPALAFLVVQAARSDLLAGATGGQLAYASFAGVITAVPLLLFAAVARSVPFTVLGPISYLIPTINFLLGVVVYDEPFDRIRLVGFALVWVGLALVAVDTVRTARRATPEPVAAATS